MFKKILLPITLIFAPQAHSACQPDAAQIGDIGPSSQIVCQLLESQFPQSESSIVDRKIITENAISINVVIDGKAQLLSFNLKGANWKPMQ